MTSLNSIVTKIAAQARHLGALTGSPDAYIGRPHDRELHWDHAVAARARHRLPREWEEFHRTHGRGRTVCDRSLLGYRQDHQ